jgi:hypothetical protein
MNKLGRVLIKHAVRYVRSMSAIPPKVDIRRRDWHLRFVPTPDMLTLNARVLSAQYSSKDTAFAFPRFLH